MNASYPCDRIVPWTRLQDEPIYERARLVMTSNHRRHFHCFDHNIDLYEAAANIYDLPYERALDLAILTHDVIFDSQSDRELRSIAWLRDQLPRGEDDPDFERAARMIETTIDHKISQDPRLVMLDLSGFIEPEIADRNTALLRQEARELHGISDTCFNASCGDYLARMLSHFRPGRKSLDNKMSYHHEEICSGIGRTRHRLDQSEVMLEG